MKSIILVFVLIIGFAIGVFGQNGSLPKLNPGKRVVKYVNYTNPLYLDSPLQSDTTHYVYPTTFGTLATIVRSKKTKENGDIYWRLDSIVYNSMDQLIARNSYSRKDSVATFELKVKTTIAYDVFTQSKTQFYFYLDSGAIVLAHKDVIEYYTSGIPKRSTGYKWNIDSARWELSGYDSWNKEGRILESVITEFIKFVYEYDMDGVLLAEKLFGWNDSYEFYPYNKTKNEVVDGKIMISNYYHRNYFSGIWHFTGRKLYSYNSSGLKEKMVLQNAKLVNREKSEYLYDSQDRFVERLYSVWDTTNNSFIYKHKTEKFYNSQPRHEILSTSRWDPSTLTWNATSTRAVYYAEDNSVDSMYTWGKNNGEELETLTEIQFNVDKTILKKVFSNWDAVTNSWVAVNTKTWYFEDFEKKPIEEPFLLSVYPNPATEYIQFYTESSLLDVDISIYSLDGRLMVTKNLNQTNKVNVGKWPTGVYFYVLSKDNRQLKSGSFLTQ